MIASHTSSPLLHSINDTKLLLNCGRNTVYNLVKRNELTLIKMGRRSLITDESINALVARKVTEAKNRAHLHDHVCENKRQVKTQDQ